MESALIAFVVSDVGLKGSDVKCEDGVMWKWCWYLENGVEEVC